MRRIRSPCCARAASGQTATLLPRSAMNSRRLMGAYPKAKDHEPIIARCVAQKACSRSFRLDARELDHLGPLLGFVGNEFPEIGGRERDHGAAEVGKPRLDLGISKAGVDLLV